MGATKPKPVKSASTGMKAVRLLLKQPYRSLFCTSIVVLVFIAGAIYAWQRWGESGTPAAGYELLPDQVYVTPQPPWILTDVKQDVVRTANLARLDVRDARLAENVASAFALHPWVARVQHVQKRYPPAVEVKVEYRRPTAVVEISPQGEAGLLFVDAESVLLPSADFRPNQAQDYLRIPSGDQPPTGMYGTPWGSEQIAGAARLAAAWGERWKPLQLYRIVPRPSRDGAWLYEMETKKGARLIWGAAPGSESSGEPPAAMKIAALEQLVAERGPLDDLADLPLDLRQLARTERLQSAD